MKAKIKPKSKEAPRIRPCIGDTARTESGLSMVIEKINVMGVAIGDCGGSRLTAHVDSLKVTSRPMNWISLGEARTSGRGTEDFLFGFLDSQGWIFSTSRMGWEKLKAQGWTHAVRITLPNFLKI